jgi:hypothetical protein
MRNYIEELFAHGMTIQRVSKETGISARRLNGLAVGMSKLKSGSKQYEKIRNLSRRMSYAEVRKSGMSPKQASKQRRVVLREKTLIKTSRKTIHHSTHGQQYFQLRMLAKWQSEEKPYPERIIDSYSTAHQTKFPIKEILAQFEDGGWEALTDEGYGQAHHLESAQDAFDECLIHARGQLNGSNWILVKIYRLEWVVTNAVTD